MARSGTTHDPQSPSLPHQHPFEGLRVINFGWVWAAPSLGQTLGDMGAQVIKIESHKRPDMVRVIPPLAKDLPLESLFGHCILRDHYGVTLDLTHPKGQEIAYDLVRSADVVIENFSPRVLPRYGLDYANLKKVRPDVVMVSLSAAGQDGPSAQITTYGSVIASLAGMDFHQGYLDGNEPVPFGTAISDPLVGVLGAFAVLCALRYRAQSGKGQYIDLSQWEAVGAMEGGPFMDSILNRRTLSHRANTDEMMAPHGVYPSKGEDLWVTIAVKTEEEWLSLCAAMGQPELARDPRFADAFRRMRQREELDAIIGSWTAERTNFDVTRLLQAVGIAAFPSLDPIEVYTDEHYAARDTYIWVDHHLGREVIYGMPWKLDKTPGGVRTPAPSVGQDNDQVYSEVLGLTIDEIRALEEEKVIY